MSDVTPALQHWHAVEHWQRRWIATATVAMALTYLVGIVFVSGVSQPMVQGDARSYFAYLPSIVLDVDLDLTNQFDQLRPEEDGDPRYPFGEGANGYAANPFPIGPALLWMPGYMAGLALDSFAGWIGYDTGPYGYGLFATWGAALAGIVLAGFGAELSRRTVAQIAGPEFSLPATLLIWAGTPALYYTLVSPLYSHAAAWFALALVFWLSWCAFRGPADWRRWLIAGIAAGFLFGVRLQDAPLLLVSLILLLSIGNKARDLPAAAAAAVGGVIIGYLPQAYTWHALHGEWIPRQNLGEPGPLSLSRLWAVLFSVGYEGWLTWTPLAAVALVGLVFKWRSSRSSVARHVALGALIGIAALVLVDVIHPYGQGAAFGARRYVTATPYLIFGLAGALVWCDRTRRLRSSGPLAIVALTAAGVWLFVAYELLIIREGHYGSLLDTWRYALGMWS